MSETRLPLPLNTRKRRTRPAVKKSSTTMMFLLFIRSAIRPPMGDMTTSGRNATPDTTPRSAADPVTESRCSGRAKRMTAFPNREMI